jgi:hypothetical protein
MQPNYGMQSISLIHAVLEPSDTHPLLDRGNHTIVTANVHSVTARNQLVVHLFAWLQFDKSVAIERVLRPEWGTNLLMDPPSRYWVCYHRQTIGPDGDVANDQIKW